MAIGRDNVPSRDTHNLLVRLSRRARTTGFNSTFAYVWRQTIPKLTGVPILSDGQVTSSVFVGPQHGRAGLWVLRLAGIGHTISLRSEFDDAAHGLTVETHCHIPVDDYEAPTVDALREGVASIREAVERGARVYIHCNLGRGRAPTLAAAYLISHGVPRVEALERVHRARSSVNITPPQQARLTEFAEIVQRERDSPGPI